MASDYLYSLLPTAADRLMKGVRVALALSQCRVTSLVLQGRVEVRGDANPLEKVIKELQESYPAEDAFQQRLLERTLREKEALEARLQTLDSTLQLLRTPEPDPLPAKPRLSEARRELSVDRDRLTTHSKDFIRTMKQRKRAEFESAFHQIQREIQAKVQKAEEREQQRQAEQQQRRLAFHDTQLARFQQKVATHKALSPLATPKKKQGKSPNGRIRTSSPPELQLHSSKEKLNIEELKEHEKKYMQFRQETEARREKALADRRALLSTPSLTPPHTPETAKRQQVLKSLVDRRQRYSELVREIFRPEVDPQKKEAREELVAQMTKPKGRKPLLDSVQRKSDSVIRHFSVWKRSEKPRKLKSLSPQTPVRARKNYLEEMKRQREDLAFNEIEGGLEIHSRLEGEGKDGSEIRAEAERLVEKLKRHEAALKVVPVTHPKALDIQETLSCAMVSAVKAKLALFASSLSPA